MTDLGFTYRASADGKVFVSWRGKVIKTLKDAEAKTFLSRVDGADAEAAQLVMAKVTGNFKRGNERR